VEYLVRLTDRVLRDVELIYEFIETETSDKAFAWFNELAEAIYNLEKLPQRGTVASENKKPNVYRIIYAIDRQHRAVNVLHIRHGSRTSLRAKPESRKNRDARNSPLVRSY
jgi:plasmid stabilization system protein ParE